LHLPVAHSGVYLFNEIVDIEPIPRDDEMEELSPRRVSSLYFGSGTSHERFRPSLRVRGDRRNPMLCARNLKDGAPYFFGASSEALSGVLLNQEHTRVEQRKAGLSQSTLRHPRHMFVPAPTAPTCTGSSHTLAGLIVLSPWPSSSRTSPRAN